jgi:putative (di)nucleoside polyphosphate hydrolase
MSYRPNVCLIIINPEKKIFLGERAGEPGHWQLPQGGLESGDLFENALREAVEELGAKLTDFEVLRKLEYVHQYDFRVVPEYAKNLYRGQRQNFVLLKFKAADTAINLAVSSKEFSSFCWCSREEVLTRAFPLRLAGYKQAFQELKDSEVL